MGKPHDSLFRDTFSQPVHAKALLRAVLPAALRRAIDWDSLRPVAEYRVDEHQRSQHTDLLFTVRIRGRPALLYVVFEHKSRPDRWTALQVLG